MSEKKVSELTGEALHIIRPEDADEIRKYRSAVKEAVFAIGELELAYLAKKAELARALDATQSAFQSEVTDAAKAIGLHPNRKKYHFDESAMTFRELPESPGDSQSPSAAIGAPSLVIARG